jgi:putative DNA primase/helicase
VLWRLSEGKRNAGCMIFVQWLGEEARARWAQGFGDRGSLEEIYKAAQRAGWRYPIAVNLNRLEEMAERIEATLVRAGAEIYQSGNRLVRPVVTEQLAAKGKKTKQAVLNSIDQSFLKSQLTNFVDFFHWNKDGSRRSVGPQNDVVQAILSRYGKWTFLSVTGVITAPTLRRDGSVLAKEGWDAETGLLVVGPLPKMPELAERPSREDADRAIRILDGELLQEFPFVDEPSRSAALSGLISPLVRAALTCVPLHATHAPAPGTGKSFLWDVSAAIAMGDSMPVAAAGADREELEKRLRAMIIQGLVLFSIDNVTAPLGGDALCQAIERPMLSAVSARETELAD